MGAGSARLPLKVVRRLCGHRRVGVVARRRAHDKHPLLEVERLEIPVEHHLEASGEVFATFLQQDSGYRSYGVMIDDQRWFVKASWRDDAAEPLQRAVVLHRAVAHRHVIPLRHVIVTPAGLALVYPWVDGEVLYGAPVDPSRRRDPAGPHARFRALPVPEVVAAVDAIFDAHLAMVATGFVAVDLYDGCFIYDFARRHVWLCDLDEYRPGPFVVDADRLPGSTRFVAPEEWQRGAQIDERTTVFNLGRCALVLLDEGDDEGRFRGPADAAAVLARATRPDPRDRHQTLRAFVDDWRAAVA